MTISLFLLEPPIEIIPSPVEPLHSNPVLNLIYLSDFISIPKSSSTMGLVSVPSFSMPDKLFKIPKR